MEIQNQSSVYIPLKLWHRKYQCCFEFWFGFLVVFFCYCCCCCWLVVGFFGRGVGWVVVFVWFGLGFLWCVFVGFGLVGWLGFFCRVGRGIGKLRQLFKERQSQIIPAVVFQHSGLSHPRICPLKDRLKGRTCTLLPVWNPLTFRGFCIIY